MRAGRYSQGCIGFDGVAFVEVALHPDLAAEAMLDSGIYEIRQAPNG